MIQNLNFQRMDSGQAHLEIAIPEYDQLGNPPSLNEDLLNQIDTHIKGANWADSHQCITMIRSILKYFPQYTPDLMGRYGSIILDIFSNGKTQIRKNIFKLLKEMFECGQTVAMDKCVVMFLPVLIKKSANEIGHIKDMCQEILTIIASQCGYSETFQITAELSCDKNNQIAELSIKLLAILLQNIGAALTQLAPKALQMIVQAMSFLIHGKRNNMKTSALDICIFIYNQIAAENFLQLMNYSLSESDVMTVGQAMETHRTQKSKFTHLADVLKQRKSTLMNENMNNKNNCNAWQNQSFR